MATESTTRIERRTSPRVPVRYPIVYFYAAPNSPRMHTIDLSEGGAAIEAQDPLPLGAAISFVIVAGNDHVVEANGTVVHVHAAPQVPYRVGVSFPSTTPGVREILLQSRPHPVTS